MNRFKDIMTGEASKKVAIFWFSLLGFVGAIATIEVVGLKVDSWLIIAASKVSYFFLFLWLKASIDQAIWWAFPSYNPEFQDDESEEAHTRMWRGGRWAAVACVLLYWFVSNIVEAVVVAQNA